MSSKTKTAATKEEATPALVPKLRFPEFRGAKGWTGEKLRSKTKKVGSGITPTGGEKNYKRSGRPFVRSQNIGWGELLLDDVAFIDEETHNSFSSTQIDVFDVLLNITGASIGRSAVADARIEGGNVNQHVCIIRVKPDELSPYFLNQYFNSHDGQKQVDSFQAGGNRQGLNFEQIRSFLIPLPAVFAEQQKIAECLSSVDELMAAQARKVDALKTHKKGLMQQLFPREGETQPRLRFPEFQNAPAWKVKPLGRVAENLDNQRVPITSSARKAGDVPYYGASGIVDYVEDFIFDEDLLCVSEDGANLVARTSPIAFPISGKTWVNNHAHVLRFENAYTQKFVEVYLNSIKLDDFITGMAQPKLNKAMLDRIPIPHPLVPEQQLIADCLSSLDALITAETQKLETLKTHKRGLMQQLFPLIEDIES